MRPVFPVGRRFVSLSAFCWMLLVCGLSQPDRLVWFCWIGLGWVSPQARYSAALLMLYFCIFFFYPVLGESEFCGPQLPKLIFTRMMRQEGYGIGGLIPRESVSNMFNRGLPQQQGEQQCIRQQ